MSTPTLSGIVTKAADQSIVPASRRPDGTLRKEIKIRPGYTPPEDVAKYSNDRLETSRVVAKSEYPVGYTPPAEKKDEPVGSGTKKSKSQKKNERRKAKRAEEADGSEGERDVPAVMVPKPKKEEAKASAPVPALAPAPAQDSAPADPQKKIKALEKKLRQAEQLKEKQAKGEPLLPEQMEKIDKMADLEEELRKLKVQ
ncbi:hypothetical protein BC936DRAFT_149915 [Jimgerdemannia flammicorona]|uniref:WIBG Mago-binding domain-containing protein n=1 Tax=Jimgerdemannia flammicorona TaxID=994334 RepID=A0A433DK58_9FUNG|nr:hypothetical protein BC936DRAFT_149915 [Jimgerdemannia flammicorona]